MEESVRVKQQSNDRSLFLMNHLKLEQEKFLENTSSWLEIQLRINQIIAERYLQYLNR